MAVRGYVYFVACAEPECRKAHPFIKIGKTKKLENRLSALQTGSPVELKFVGHIRTEAPEDLERYLHKTFERAKIYGEWYRISPGMITTLRHYTIVNDLFDEFFSEAPVFGIDPVTKAWMDRCRKLEQEVSRLDPNSNAVRIGCPRVSTEDARRAEWGRVKR